MGSGADEATGTSAGQAPASRPYRVLPSDPQAAAELGRACGVGAAIGQILLHRGLRDAEAARSFLDPRLSDLSVPDAMADRGAAIDRLARAIRAGERIVVFGDYDVDGTTSAAVLAGILEMLGGNVRAFVAHRFEGGYGFSEMALARCREGADLIVTCDCGSSDHERIESARRAGVDVIVVDHHLVPDEPLPALAFLNPHRPDCGYPYKGLTSAGLALTLGAGVRAALDAKVDLRAWLDLVALGTIADVAPLDGDNRRLVRAGLRLLASSSVRPGIAALKELARIRSGSPLGAIDVAFRITPRLNAAGRLGDASLTLELLRENDATRARLLAAKIEQINLERKDIERRMTEEAIRQVAEVYGDGPSAGIVVAHPEFHRGVVGITAARLVDRFGVPALCIAFDGEHGHGSGRAPEGFPLYDAASRCRDLFTAFGGHSAAIGFSLSSHHLDALRSAFADASAPRTSESSVTLPTVDVELDGARFSLPDMADLLALEPLGEANEEPLFALPDAAVEGRRVVGETHLKLELRVGSRRISAFGREMGAHIGALAARITAVGHLRPDTFRGESNVELHLTGVPEPA